MSSYSNTTSSPTASTASAAPASSVASTTKTSSAYTATYNTYAGNTMDQVVILRDEVTQVCDNHVDGG